MNNITTKKNTIILICMAGMSLIAAGLSAFMSQDIFNTAAGKDESYTAVSIAVTAAAAIALLCLALILRINAADAGKKAGGKGIGIGGSLPRIALYTVFACAAAGILSLLSGLISVALYKLTENMLTLSTIKGILNIIIAGLFMLVIPLFVSAFWAVMCQSGSFIKDFISGFKPGWRKYIKIMIAMLVLLAAGFLISAVFNYASGGVFVKILKTIIFGITGTIGMYAAYSICRKN